MSVSFSPRLPSLRLFRLLLWVHWRTLVARVRGIQQQSRLLLFVLGASVVGYLMAAYWLFAWGLDYLHKFPLIGTLISQRVLFLIFGFLFVMLIFSNAIIGYASLFKNRETNWLLTLPIAQRDVYRWKFSESLVVSSWAFIFLCAPLMVAYGRVNDVPSMFYIEVLAAFLPFIIIPALAGSWGIVLLVHLRARGWVKKLLIALAGAAVVYFVFTIKPVSDTEAAHAQDVLSFDTLLRHTRISMHPLLPSAWLARSVLSWSEGFSRQGAFYFLLSLSNALMGLVVGFEVVGRVFYESWSAVLSSRAERDQRKMLRQQEKIRYASRGEIAMRWIPFFSRPVKSLALKDVRLFWRDPAQWTQFMIFFGLLCIYVLNLRNVAFDFQNDFWATVISYLNLAASSLTLSTLTTRFVFPQFSLEGRRLWIIGLAPIGLRKVLLQKFGLSCVASMSVTVSLMISSSLMLHLPWSGVLFFAGAIATMSLTLCGLAVGLGALFPNLKEENPSKIVSGYGGTLCLIISFIYISFFVALLAIPGLRRVMPITFFLPNALALGLAALISACVATVPMLLAMRCVKNLEF